MATIIRTGGGGGSSKHPIQLYTQTSQNAYGTLMAYRDGSGFTETAYQQSNSNGLNGSSDVPFEGCLFDQYPKNGKTNVQVWTLTFKENVAVYGYTYRNTVVAPLIEFGNFTPGETLDIAYEDYVTSASPAGNVYLTVFAVPNKATTSPSHDVLPTYVDLNNILGITTISLGAPSWYYSIFSQDGESEAHGSLNTSGTYTNVGDLCKVKCTRDGSTGVFTAVEVKFTRACRLWVQKNFTNNDLNDSESYYQEFAVDDVLPRTNNGYKVSRIVLIEF